LDQDFNALDRAGLKSAKDLCNATEFGREQVAQIPGLSDHCKSVLNHFSDNSCSRETRANYLQQQKDRQQKLCDPNVILEFDAFLEHLGLKDPQVRPRVVRLRMVEYVRLAIAH